MIEVIILLSFTLETLTRKKPNIFINFDSAEGANDSVTFTNASLSSCVDTSSGWALKAEQIEINDELGKGSDKKNKIRNL